MKWSSRASRRYCSASLVTAGPPGKRRRRSRKSFLLVQKRALDGGPGKAEACGCGGPVVSGFRRLDDLSPAPQKDGAFFSFANPARIHDGCSTSTPFVDGRGLATPITVFNVL